MGHGLAAEACLSIGASDRMKRIPAHLLPLVRSIVKDATYDTYDLMRSYYGGGYPPKADVINGQCQHRILRRDTWTGSDVYEEIEIAIAEAKEKQEEKTSQR